MMATRSTAPLILIADDDATIRLIARETLLASDFRVVVANDGREALEAFRQYDPDAVLIDAEMPDMDGYAFCEAVREEERSLVPIVMMTGHEDVRAIHRAYQSGATDFVHKPVRWPVIPYRLRYGLRASALQQQFSVNEQRTRALLEALPDTLFLLDPRGIITEEFSGPDLGEPAGDGRGLRSLEDMLPGEVARCARDHLQTALATREPQTFEYQMEGGHRVYETRLVPQPDDITIAIVRDVTQRHRSEAQVRRLAYLDTITGLPNRQLFLRELRRAMRQSKRSGRLTAVLYIDLDRFKRINDTLGHSVGDALLKSVAERLERCIRPTDFLGSGLPLDEAGTPLPDQHPRQLARLGGDEFVVLLNELECREQAGVVASRIRNALSAPFSYERRQFVVTPSIGIALYPHDGQEVETLLMRADTAMYKAKAAGRNTVRFYEQSMDARALERLELEDDLRQAIEKQAFCLHFQPKHALADGRIVGAEALLRWEHPVRGWVPPAQFIPLAEETGLIVPLSEWVIDEACRHLRDWRGKGLDPVTMAINISPEQVARSDVGNKVLRAIWEHGVRPQCLELEITESLLMRDISENQQMLRSLKDAGVRLSIDDFGTGYSSLSYLRQFPLDALKIDRSFVQDLHRDQDDAAICLAIIAMGKSLGLKIVAEGIELEEQRDFLAAAGCDEAQGFLYSRPMPAPEFERHLRSIRRGHHAEA